jgi:hypothetical protein
MPYGYDARNAIPDLSYMHSWVNPTFQGVGQVVQGVGQIAQNSQDEKAASTAKDQVASEISDFQRELEANLSPEAKSQLSPQFEQYKRGVPVREPGESLQSYQNKLNMYRGTVVASTAKIAGEDAMQRAAMGIMSKSLTPDQIAAVEAKYADTKWAPLISAAKEAAKQRESGGTTQGLFAGAMNTSTDPNFVGPIQPRPQTSSELQTSAYGALSAGKYIAPTDQAKIDQEIADRRARETTQKQVEAMQTPGLTTQSQRAGAAIPAGGYTPMQPAANTVYSAMGAEQTAAADAAEQAAKDAAAAEKARQQQATGENKELFTAQAETGKSTAAVAAAQDKLNKLKTNPAATPEQIADAESALAVARGSVTGNVGREAELTTMGQPTAYKEATRNKLREQYVKPFIAQFKEMHDLSTMPKTDVNLKNINTMIDKYAAGLRVTPELQSAVEGQGPRKGKKKKGAMAGAEITTFAQPTPADQPLPDDLKEWARQEIYRELGLAPPAGAGSMGGAPKQAADMTDAELDTELSKRVPDYATRSEQERAAARDVVRKQGLPPV